MNKKNQSIRVLHLVEHLEVGGAERVIADLVRELDTSKIHSTVCLYRSMGLFSHALQKAGHSVFFLNKEIMASIRFFRPPFVILESIIFVIRLAHFIRKNKIQVLHSHMFSANMWGRLAALLAGRPGIIVTEHTTAGWQDSSKEILINRLLTPFTDRLVVVSQAVAETIEKEQQFPMERVVVIPNGIKTIAPKESKNIKKGVIPENLPGAAPIIATVSRLVEVKRIDLFFQALKKCVDREKVFNCWIIGDGPERESLEKIAKDLELSDKVFFLGEREDVRYLLGHVNLLVNSSDHEGLPVSVLEAMIEGVPVVATNVGGTGELIEPDRTGILVEAGDVDGIAHGICRFLDNPEEARKIGIAGQAKIVEEYALDKIARRWEELYREVATLRGTV